jgi:hypothetical protein
VNRDYVLYNLREAQEELERTIRELEKDSDYDFGEFVVAMSHLYLHINTAWNARDATKSQAEKCSEADFDKWRRFPDPQELLLV